MSDQHRDTDLRRGELHDAFESFRSDHLPTVTPPGVPAAHATLRLRRRVRLAAAGLGTAVAVLIAGGVVALGGRHGFDAHPTDPRPAVSQPAATTPTPAPSSPAASPSVVAGRVTAAELRDVRFRIYDWKYNACDGGLITFRDFIGQTGSTTGSLTMSSTTHPVWVDADGDGNEETIVAVHCAVSRGDCYQVIALDRGPHGTVVALGLVALSFLSFRSVEAMRAAPHGRIQVKWTNHNGQPESNWSTYRWWGEGFTQTGGPSSMQIG